MKTEEVKNKLIVALDVGNLEDAQRLVNELCSVVKIFKIGSQLFTACGHSAIDIVHEKGCNVFLDLKFHDIPNTVAQASSAVTKYGVFMFDIHVLGGLEMMEAAVRSSKAESERLNIKKPILLGVTILTHLDRGQLNSLGIMRSVRKEVLYLSKLAKEAGLDGVISSPKEVRYIRKAMGANFIIVVPGVRPEWSEVNDQKRVLTPQETIRAGASYIVIGRPITKAPNPVEAVEKILTEITNL